MTAELRDVEEIRADVARAGANFATSLPRATLEATRIRLASDVAPLLARLAVASRENAALREELAGIPSSPNYSGAESCCWSPKHHTLHQLAAERDEARGEVVRLRAELERKGESIENRDDVLRDLTTERDELRGEVERLRTWLAASQAEARSALALRDAAKRRAAAAVEECDRALRELGGVRAEAERVGRWIDDYKREQESIIAKHMVRAHATEARLEAVRAEATKVVAALRSMQFSKYRNQPDWAWMNARGLADRLRAALAAAPQPEPKTKTAAELLREIAKRDPEAHGAALARGYGVDRDPANYPDPIEFDPALLSPISRRNPFSAELPASDEPARCEHGHSYPHLYREGFKAGACSGPNASGTPDGSA